MIISNEEMDDIMKIVTYFKESGLVITRVGEIIKNETKEPKGRFLGMFQGTLGVGLLGNMLGVVGSGDGVIQAGEGTNRVGPKF